MCGFHTSLQQEKEKVCCTFHKIDVDVRGWANLQLVPPGPEMSRDSPTPVQKMNRRPADLIREQREHDLREWCPPGLGNRPGVDGIHLRSLRGRSWLPSLQWQSTATEEEQVTCAGGSFIHKFLLGLKHVLVSTIEKVAFLVTLFSFPVATREPRRRFS